MTWDTIDPALDVTGGGVYENLAVSLDNGLTMLALGGKDEDRKENKKILHFDPDNTTPWTLLDTISTPLCVHIFPYDLNYIVKV